MSMTGITDFLNTRPGLIEYHRKNTIYALIIVYFSVYIYTIYFNSKYFKFRNRYSYAQNEANRNKSTYQTV